MNMDEKAMVAICFFLAVRVLEGVGRGVSMLYLKGSAINMNK